MPVLAQAAHASARPRTAAAQASAQPRAAAAANPSGRGMPHWQRGAASLRGGVARRIVHTDAAAPGEDAPGTGEAILLGQVSATHPHTACALCVFSQLVHVGGGFK